MNENTKHLPWVEKYRPKIMNDIISNEEMIRSLKEYIKMKTLPHLLFFGPSGSGKTSTIMCCAFEIYGEYIPYMIMRLNASNERGIDIVRSKIKNFVSNKNNIFLPKERQDLFKMVILDEIDSMTVEAQGMLRQTIEKFSTTTRFCLICNEIDKINLALQSRCTSFRFSPLRTEDMKLKIIEICKNENIKHKKGAAESIVSVSNGDMRAAINLLQLISININNREITLDDVYKISSHCHPKVFEDTINKLASLTNKKNKNLYEDAVNDLSNNIMNNNVTISNLLEEIKKYTLKSNMLVSKKIYIIDELAKYEIYDSVSIDPNNIIMSIVGIFIQLKNIH